MKTRLGDVPFGLSSRGASLERPAAGRSLAIERGLMQRLLYAAGEPGIRMVLWDGAEITCNREAPQASLILRDRRTLWRLIAAPALGFGDGYAEGRIEVEGGLVALLEAVTRGLLSGPRGTFRRHLARWLGSRPRANTRRGSRSNIHHHYDLGNDFYRLWLDEELVYTCAYYASPDLSLEAAQQSKMDHVCRKLVLRPGERVVEAGCGWGSLALHMAKHYGVAVKAFNISSEQIELARERARVAGLCDRVEFIDDDYRNLSGRFDKFVSVGMLEHVGRENYGDLGRVIDRCLTADGVGLIHSIGRNRPQGFNAWTSRRIFPGAYAPSLGEMMEIFEPWNFSVLDVENLRLHYARTLETWLERFEGAQERVLEMFDERFVRAWRLYLAASIAGFRTGGLQLFQVVFARHAMNGIPLTRAHLYLPGESPGAAHGPV